MATCGIGSVCLNLTVKPVYIYIIFSVPESVFPVSKLLLLDCPGLSGTIVMFISSDNIQRFTKPETVASYQAARLYPSDASTNSNITSSYRKKDRLRDHLCLLYEESIMNPAWGINVA